MQGPFRSQVVRSSTQYVADNHGPRRAFFGLRYQVRPPTEVIRSTGVALLEKWEITAESDRGIGEMWGE